MNYDKTILNLKTISRIEKSSKLYIDAENNIMIDSYSIFRPFKRFYYGFNRESTLNAVFNIYTHANERMKFLLDSQYTKKYSQTNREMIQDENYKKFIDNYEKIVELSEELTSSISGLLNLQETYKHDVSVYVRIEFLIKTIKSMVMKAHSVLDYLKSTNPIYIPSLQLHQAKLKPSTLDTIKIDI